MTAVAGQLVGTIPHQPIGTKVAYRVRLAKMDRQLTLPAKDAVVLQFRGDVPAWALMPHVFVMLIAIFLSTLAGLEVLLPQPRLGVLVARTIAALVVGILLGCLTAWYAYGSLWSGFPVGDDVTANKTLLALVVWLAAAVALKVGRNPKPYVVIASVLTLAVYLIPHGAAIRK